MNYQRRALIASAFTPASPISSTDLFAGRMNHLIRVADAILERGQHVVLYGERGVGKTSLANVASQQISNAVIVRCDSTDTFETTWV